MLFRQVSTLAGGALTSSVSHILRQQTNNIQMNLMDKLLESRSLLLKISPDNRNDRPKLIKLGRSSAAR
jgi:hypothetical protein